jgi:hypothetical protein
VLRAIGGVYRVGARKTVELAIDGGAATVEIAEPLTVPLDARVERLGVLRPPWSAEDPDPHPEEDRAWIDYPARTTRSPGVATASPGLLPH